MFAKAWLDSLSDGIFAVAVTLLVLDVRLLLIVASLCWRSP
jgi:uncharacterized membrane protein